MNHAQVAIIGAGPLGIEFAIACKQNGVSCLQFDKGQIAQAIYDFPFQTPFFSSSERIGIAGIPLQTANQQKCTREAYLAYMRSVVMHHGLQINTYEEVVEIKREGGGDFTLRTNSRSGEKSYVARSIVLATGGTSVPRRLAIPGESLEHVSVKMEDPHRYFGKRVLIVGGKNSAVEAALRCFHAGAAVTISLRKGAFDEKEVKYWLLPELWGRIKRGEIACHFSSQVVEIFQDRAVLFSSSEERSFIVPCDFVIKALGFNADMTLFKQLGIALETEQEHPAFNPESMETNVPNVYVLGTAVGGTQGRYKVYIENTHHHVGKIIKSLCGKLGQEVIQQPWYLQSYKPQGPLEE